jgi:hypothetical protein
MPLTILSVVVKDKPIHLRFGITSVIRITSTPAPHLNFPIRTDQARFPAKPCIRPSRAPFRERFVQIMALQRPLYAGNQHPSAQPCDILSL